jgi:CrcB protein
LPGRLTTLGAIAAGGAGGAVARYLVSGWVQRARPLAALGRWGPALPWGTFAVNLTGCFAMGLLAGLLQERFVVAPEARALLLIGVLGGYTTFSSFALETLRLAQDGSFLPAAANVLGSVVLCLAGVWAGDLAARLI